MRNIVNSDIMNFGKIFILTVALVISCKHPYSSLDATKAPSEPNSISPAHQQIKEDQNGSFQSFRHIDFRNFEYPITDQLLEFLAPKKYIRLVDGMYDVETDPNTGRVTKPGLFFIASVYADVNGNPKDEEAIIFLGTMSGGSGSTQCVYIYGRKFSSDSSTDKPSLLWKFGTGDRSHGGLRQVYGENGNLIVELYNNDTSHAYDGSVDPGGACCPKTYTRATYEWTGLRYQLIAAERLKNPTGDSSPIVQLSK